MNRKEITEVNERITVVTGSKSDENGTSSKIIMHRLINKGSSIFLHTSKLWNLEFYDVSDIDYWRLHNVQYE